MKNGKRYFGIFLAIIIFFVIFSIFGVGDDVKGAINMRFGIDIRGGVEAIFEPVDLKRKPTSNELESARIIIENRLDAQNVTDREVTVDKKGGYIIVRFPWKSDETDFNPENAIKELGEMAKLTFRDSDGNILLEGKNVENAKAVKDNSLTGTKYMVSLSFDNEGEKLFQKATKELVGKNMPIYMDEVLISNPRVEGEISGGEAVINNIDTYKEANELAQKINSGALPFSLSTTSFSTISPTLGNNALYVMVVAGIIALFIVCMFMILYYKMGGVIACIALLFQVSLQLLSISLPQFTLTLPGIAGIILSVGMAVDANIIISERISEELKNKIPLKLAVKNGYKNAFSSVIDGNITTALVAVILMIFGSGTMLSFGYTLLMGMILNVFIGVNISKKLFLSLLDFKKFNNEKYYKIHRNETKIRKFYEKKFVVVIITVVILVLGIGGSIVNGIKLDTQFTGGVVLSYKISGDDSTTNLESAIEKVTNRPVTIQTSKSNVEDSLSLVVTLAGSGGISPEMQKEITNEIKKDLPNTEVSLSQTYAVEPYIGERALRNSQIAIAVSILFIVVYVWIRFSNLGGLSAGITSIIALIQDCFVVFTVFVVFKIPLNDAFVSVVLTIIGYSINDTIVLYDRIRENRFNNSKLGVVELINTSISQTLTRSINTSLTTGICVLIILIASLIYGISSIKEFALPMFFGLISGCYSSMFIASTLWAMWKNRKKNLI